MKSSDYLYPRFRVDRSYPKSPFEIGQVIELPYKRRQLLTTQSLAKETWFTGLVKIKDTEWSQTYNLDFFVEWPDIFTSLQWWEERPLESMPKYVKVISHDISLKVDYIGKPLSWGLFEDRGYNMGNENQPYALFKIEESSRTHNKDEEVRIHATHLKPESELEYKVEKIKLHFGPNHSAYKQAALHLQKHMEGEECPDAWLGCVIDFEYNKTLTK